MACATKGKCEYAYIKQGSNAMHCVIQRDNGGKWDFCAHQQFCRAANRYTLNQDAANCTLPAKMQEDKSAVAEKNSGSKDKSKKRTTSTKKVVNKE